MVVPVINRYGRGKRRRSQSSNASLGEDGTAEAVGGEAQAEKAKGGARGKGGKKAKLEEGAAPKPRNGDDQLHEPEKADGSRAAALPEQVGTEAPLAVSS